MNLKQFTDPLSHGVFICPLQEGTVSSWGLDTKLQRFIKTNTDSCKARDLWVTYFVILQNINKVALSFTSKEIGKRVS